MNMNTIITTDEAIKLLGLATKPRVTKEIELSVAPDVADKFIEAINMAIEALGKSKPHWIPVTERLPENGRQVLIFATSVHYALAKYDEMREADGTYKKQWVTFDAWKPFYSIKEVIAWCELPELSEPYRCIGR